MRMLLPSALIVQIMIGIGCGESPSALEARQSPEPRPSISDAAHGGQDHFYFLPPLVPQPDYSGTFDPTRSPVVSICKVEGTACGSVIGEFTMTTGPGSETVRVDTLAEHYIVNWHTNEFDLEEGAIYRIRVLVEGQEVGHADVLAVSGGNQLKNAESDDVIPLKDGRTLPIKFRIEVGLVVRDEVPLVPPDSTPAAVIDEIYAESNIIDGSPYMTGRFPSDVVWVAFQYDATQEERQSAIDLIDGEVVGGIFMNPGGLYYVRISTDGTAETLFAAIEMLESLPQVRFATPDLNLQFSLFYRRPNDGSQWERSSWQLDRSMATGANWALEDIAAPLAWGCSIGDSTQTVGIVDKGFHHVRDLGQNIVPNPDIGRNPSEEHGTNVASIIGAIGNNSDGMTGVMWRARIHVEDFQGRTSPTGNPAYTPYEALRDMVRAKVPIINLSAGYYWLEIEGRQPNASSHADSAKALAHGRVMYEAVTTYNFGPDNTRLPPPLFVIAAGNDDVDAWWSGVTQVADSAQVKDHVIVVAASNQAGQLWSFSNSNVGPGNDLVSIAAPGENVAFLDKSSSVIRDDGTSLAAPHVTGVAGLLKSFDPSLSAAQLKEFILEGARRGGHSADGIPILNAYESLRAVAERPGAPICGNDVWAAGGSMKVRRTDDHIEDLGSVGSPIGQVEVLHGGKFIHYLTLDGERTLRWDAATRTWASSSPPGDFLELRGGTLFSVFGFSHDADTLAYIDGTIVSGTPWFLTSDVEHAPVYVDGGGSLHSPGQIQVNDFPGPVKVTCLERSPAGCHLNVVENRTWIFRLGYPQFPGAMPDERQAYLTVSPMRHVEIDSTPWAPCTFDPSHECRAVLSLQDQTEALVYRMDLSQTGGTPDPVQTIPDESVFWIGHSEMGEGVVLARGRWRITFWADAPHFYQTGSPFFDFNSEVERCTIEYRRETNFNDIEATIPADDACNFGLFDRPSMGAGGGTIAPSRVPLSMAPRSSITTAEGAVSVTLPILDPTGEEVRASQP